jgi:hypothetical protein
MNVFHANPANGQILCDAFHVKKAIGQIRYCFAGEHKVNCTMEIALSERRKYGNHVFDEDQERRENRPGVDVMHGMPGRAGDGTGRG